MFITFEGIEGSGKSTQIKMLKEALIAKDHEVIVLREPGGTILGEKVREAFLEKTIEKISVETETFLLYASRKHLDQNLLKPSLASKKFVICDRYYDATEAYQCYGKGLSREFFQSLNKICNLSKPEITFYIDITSEISKERISNRERDRMEAEEMDFFNKVREGYLKITEENIERIYKINGIDTIENIHKKILQLVGEKIGTSLG
tara:strand:- start:778 stop:1395 length:618 start_codon:yes stop_codon:yes gene_type:complete